MCSFCEKDIFRQKVTVKNANLIIVNFFSDEEKDTKNIILFV